MLFDFRKLMPAASLCGIDISEYAVKNAIVNGIRVGNANQMGYSSQQFDLVISINTVHNLPLAECKRALQEITRVSKGNSFITVDAWRNEEERERMLAWNLTALTYMHVDDWKQLFEDVGYTGDYYWFIAESAPEATS